MNLHPSLRWRAIAPEDAPALLALVNSVEEADGRPYRMSLAELEDDLGAPWRDLGADTVVGLDEDGTPRAWTELLAPPDDVTERRVFVFGGVHPRWRGRGVGRTLVAWALERAHTLVASHLAGGHVPWRIGAFLGVDDVAAVRLFERAGLTPLRHYAMLRRDLSMPIPAVLEPDGVVVEPWTPDAEEDARLAHNAAFADHWGSQPQSAERWLEQRWAFAPGWSLVARDTHREGAPVVGYLMSERLPDDWPAQGFTSAYVDIVGVVREARGRGVASLLLARAMALYAADGIEYATLSVDTANPTGAFQLYERLGFEAYFRRVHLAVTSAGPPGALLK